jgi:hypothetical protein
MIHQIITAESEFIQQITEYIEDQKSKMQNLNKSPNPHVICPPFPGRDVISQILNLLFWASLSQEEGRAIKFRLAYDSREWNGSARCMRFAKPIKLLSHRELVKLSPSVDTYSIGVEVDEDGELSAWGFVASPRLHCLRFGIFGPARVAVLHLNVLVGIIDMGDARMVGFGVTKYLQLIERGLQLENPDYGQRLQWANQLLQLVRSMHSHRHGGTILIVPSNTKSWESCVRISDCISLDTNRDHLRAVREDAAIAENKINELELGISSGESNSGGFLHHSVSIYMAQGARSILDAALEAIARLTSVDGALVIDDNMQALCFGAQIQTKSLESVDTNLIEVYIDRKDPGKPIPIENLGGMRHRSAALFVGANPQCVAFVSSQDGGMTMFTYLQEDKAVLVLRGLELM